MTAVRNNRTASRRSEFGRAVAVKLIETDQNQTWLALQLRCSRAYVSALLKGRKLASANTADRVARAFGLIDHEITELHVAAARDRGFRV